MQDKFNYLQDSASREKLPNLGRFAQKNKTIQKKPWEDSQNLHYKISLENHFERTKHRRLTFTCYDHIEWQRL